MTLFYSIIGIDIFIVFAWERRAWIFNILPTSGEVIELSTPFVYIALSKRLL